MYSRKILTYYDQKFLLSVIENKHSVWPVADESTLFSLLSRRLSSQIVFHIVNEIILTALRLVLNFST
jgi:hypothetical protein